MEVFLVVVLICVAIYMLLKRSTARGINTVRAYMYLRAINAGASVSEANQYAHADVINGSPQTIRDAKEFVQIKFGGKQLLMIAEAKRLGLVL